MKIVTGLVVIAALVVLTAAEIRAARLGLQRQSRKESLLLAVVVLVGGSAAIVRLLISFG
jgi:hypothetical protein